MDDQRVTRELLPLKIISDPRVTHGRAMGYYHNVMGDLWTIHWLLSRFHR